MFLHEFGEDLVLALELLLQKGDPPVLGIAGVSGTGLEHGRGVFEELLLPAVEHRGVDAVPVTQVRDRGVFEEVKPQNGHLLLRREARPSFLGHGRISARRCSLFEQTICPISTEAKHGCYIAEGQPVISVDTKKKELSGQYANGGREWQPAGQPEPVNVHDFRDPRVGKAIPYGVYDVGWDLGWVNVGGDHDTAGFAVERIRRWWHSMGEDLYPDADRLLICADGGGSNGYRLRLWKVELQRWADETGLEVTVCHLPPGTSKWNKIEHRLFSHITMNWRGRPLVSHQVVVELIAATRTATGLEVEARLDRGSYPTKVKVSKEQMKQVRLKPHEFHGEWNYTIEPRKTSL